MAANRQAIEARGTQVAFVHLGTEEEAKRHVAGSGVEDIPRFSDPTGQLYRQFSLGRGGLRQLLSPKVWRRWFSSAWRHGFGRQKDSRQMPGVFLVQGGRILREFRHRTPADRPDYVALATPP